MKPPPRRLPKPYYDYDGITIYNCDCRIVGPLLEPIDLVVTSPPYAEQRDYEIERGKFIWDEVVPPALVNISLAPDGQMLVNLGLVHRDGEVICYWDSLIMAMKSNGYRLFGWNVWDKTFGLPGDWNGRFAPSHEWIFHFNKQARKVEKFIASRSKGVVHGSGFTKKDGTKSGKKSQDGQPIQPFKIPDSVVRFPPASVEKSREKGLEHPAIYPINFAKHLISAFTGVVFDPFMGSGTTLRAAKDLRRRAIGCEISEKYCEIAARRLQQEVLL